MHRPDRASKAGIVVPPALQKVKVAASIECHDEPSASSMAEYERHIQFLQRSYATKKWSIASMLTLMDQTAELLRKWVQKDSPSVSQLLEKFPCLSDPRIVSLFIVHNSTFRILCLTLQMLNKFCQMTGAIQNDFKQTWEEYEMLIMKYAPLEDKRAVKTLLLDYEAVENN